MLAIYVRLSLPKLSLPIDIKSYDPTWRVNTSIEHAISVCKSLSSNKLLQKKSIKLTVLLLAMFSFFFCCALTTGRFNVFQHNLRRTKEITDVRPKFPDYVFSCDYGINEYVLFKTNPLVSELFILSTNFS